MSAVAWSAVARKGLPPKREGEEEEEKVDPSTIPGTPEFHATIRANAEKLAYLKDYIRNHLLGLAVDMESRMIRGIGGRYTRKNPSTGEPYTFHDIHREFVTFQMTEAEVYAYRGILHKGVPRKPIRSGQLIEAYRSLVRGEEPEDEDVLRWIHDYCER